MRWRYKPEKGFVEKARALRHEYQKEALKNTLTRIMRLEDPRLDGAPYMSAWAIASEADP